MSPILEDELELLKRPELLGLRVDDYSVGVKYAVVKLSSGTVGLRIIHTTLSLQLQG